MIDSQTVASEALYAALEAATAVTGLADVWQNPPENTQPGEKGLVIIGLVSLSNEGDKNSSLDRATVAVFTQSRKPDARALYAIGNAVRNAIEGQVLTVAGAEISQIVFVSADPKLMEDGQTYEDQLSFEMYVQAA